MSSDHKYIHGYDSKEQDRLVYQNSFLSQFIYERIDLNSVQHLLEVGCGVGAQMTYILKKYPHIKVTGIDISEVQLKTAKHNLTAHSFDTQRYALIQGDAMKTLSLNTKFDGMLLVWVLEHIKDPVSLLKNAKDQLSKSARIFITEVFDSSFSIYPECPAMMNFWRKAMKLKTDISGDADIGVKLYDILSKAGYKNIEVKPYIMHLDRSRSKLRSEMYVYWMELLESGLSEMIQAGITNDIEWQKIKAEIENVKKAEDSVFYYSFVQACATL